MAFHLNNSASGFRPGTGHSTRDRWSTEYVRPPVIAVTEYVLRHAFVWKTSRCDVGVEVMVSQSFSSYLSKRDQRRLRRESTRFQWNVIGSMRAFNF